MNRFFSSTFVALVLAGVVNALPVREPQPLPGKWIVALKPETASELDLHTRWVSDIHARSIERRDDGSVGLEKKFDFPGFAGYSGSFSDETIEIIRANPNVTAVEPDQEVVLASLVEQENPPWGLSAISHANPPLSNASYIYDSSAGSETFSYVLDSGLFAEHVEYEGRAILGYDATGGAETDHSHGTHVAGIIGAATYGVAKKTSLIGVQVTGSTMGQGSWILDGLTWTANDIAAKNRKGKAVINMSLTTGSSAIVNNAVQALIDAGIPVVAAAGNYNSDTADWSPANLPDAITVAASNSNYRRWSASNWGSTVDLFAPGQAIPSTWVGSSSEVFTTSGTSMAAPYVAGIVAYLLQLEGPKTPAELKARILGLAIKDVISDRKDVPNLLLYNGNGA
ncbi:Alkaline protease 1 [Fusarium albosuccineum]|uniref:Alkaline protease 1 n=1 Tax=Fusarium albosuccineum TaxID=1237068 RepID=A0A8H4LP48_9HYPO|nr:Alkaline protease 1 [Fusarium albosuccineum]